MWSFIKICPICIIGLNRQKEKFHRKTRNICWTTPCHVAAVKNHRTQFWKGAIQGQFHESLVAIGLVVSEEKIKMWKANDRRRLTKPDGKSSRGLWPGELKKKEDQMPSWISMGLKYLNNTCIHDMSDHVILQFQFKMCFVLIFLVPYFFLFLLTKQTSFLLNISSSPPGGLPSIFPGNKNLDKA